MKLACRSRPRVMSPLQFAQPHALPAGQFSATFGPWLSSSTRFQSKTDFAEMGLIKGFFYLFRIFLKP